MPSTRHHPPRRVTVTVLAVLITAGYLLLAAVYDPGPAPAVGEPGEHWFADGGRFARFGQSLLAGDLAGVYADPWNQTGPIQTATSALALGVVDHLGYPAGLHAVHLAFTALAMAALAVLTAALVRTTPVAPPLRVLAPWAPALAVVAAVITIPTVVLFYNGHWLQLPILLAWTAAGMLASRGRPLWAGALIGLTGLAEPWGLLGLPVLLVGNLTWTSRARAAGIALLVAAAGWLPFAVQPGFALGQHLWTTYPGSVWAALGVEQAAWWMRAAQAAVIITVGLVVRCRLHGRVPDLWLAWTLPVVLMLTRLMLEVRWLNYYPSAVHVVLIAGTVALGLAGSWRALPMAAAVILTSRASVQPLLTDSPGSPFALYCALTLALVLLAVLPGHSRWPRPSPDVAS